MKKPFFFYLLLLLFPLSVIAQEVTPEVIASSGNSIKTSGGQVSWTLGEVATETFTAGETILTQGFLQSEISVETRYTDPVLQLAMKVYPVPATGFVTLDFQEIQEGLSVELYNVQGTKVISHAVNSERFQIDLSALPSSEYILKIISVNNKMIKSYTIIKQK
jgi:hypothetical protein